MCVCMWSLVELIPLPDSNRAYTNFGNRIYFCTLSPHTRALMCLNIGIKFRDLFGQIFKKFYVHEYGSGGGGGAATACCAMCMTTAVCLTVTVHESDTQVYFNIFLVYKAVKCSWLESFVSWKCFVWDFQTIFLAFCSFLVFSFKSQKIPFTFKNHMIWILNVKLSKRCHNFDQQQQHCSLQVTKWTLDWSFGRWKERRALSKDQKCTETGHKSSLIKLNQYFRQTNCDTFCLTLFSTCVLVCIL